MKQNLSKENGLQRSSMPFLIYQFANLHKLPATPRDSKWAELRESQSKLRSIPNAALAVLVDVDKADDIHPRQLSRIAHTGIRLQ